MKRISHITLEVLVTMTVSLFGVAILGLAATEDLGIYIHPSSHWFVILTGVIFLAIGISRAFFRTSQEESGQSTTSVLALLSISILIISIKPVPLSVETARIRMSENVRPVGAKNSTNLITRKTTEFGILDWLAAYANPATSFRYENAPADVSGFLLIQDGQPMIGRLVITCCGADAQPAMIPFRWSGNLPAENSWIQVKGTMRAVDSTPLLEATSLDIIPEPKNPYAE